MSWRTVRLGELVDNFSVRAKDVGGADGLDFFGVSNEEGIIKTKYAAEDKAEDYKIIEKGCFAYNPYRVNVGSIGLVSDNTRGLISPAYVIFKPKPNAIIPELLFKFLKSDEGLRQIKFYARGTVRQALRFEDLCNIEITIPEFEEQQILYNKLISSQQASNVLDAELKNQLELLKKLRQQLLQDAVHGKLVEQNPKDEPASELLKKIKAEKQKLIAEKKLKKEKELSPIKPEEIPFEIPENWVWCRLGEICDTITKGSSPNWQGVQYVDEDKGILFITSKNVDSFRIDLTKATYVEEKFNEIEPRSILKKGDLLTNIVGASIGRTALFDLDIIANINQAVCILRIEHELIDKTFLLNLMNSDLALKMMFESQFAPGRANLSMGNIANFTIPLPPLAEQNRIVQKLDELMQYCNEMEASIKQSESQNEKLLQQVLREALRKEPVGV